MLRALVVAAAMSAAFPAAAAALPPAHPPAPSVSGVHVTWPATATGATGQVLTVKVSSQRYRSALSLVSVDRNGKPVRALARRTLRSGTFTARLGPSATYALRLVVAGKSYFSWIIVPAPAAPTSAPAPAPVVNPLFLCFGRNTGTTVSMSLGVTAVHAGDELPYRLINTSAGCETAGAGWTIERPLPDGSWQNVNPGQVSIAIGYPLPPGTAFAKAAQVPTGLPPGAYRLRDSVIGAADNPNAADHYGSIFVAAPFDVVP